MSLAREKMGTLTTLRTRLCRFHHVRQQRSDLVDDALRLRLELIRGHNKPHQYTRLRLRWRVLVAERHECLGMDEPGASRERGNEVAHERPADGGGACGIAPLAQACSPGCASRLACAIMRRQRGARTQLRRLPAAASRCTSCRVNRYRPRRWAEAGGWSTALLTSRKAGFRLANTTNVRGPAYRC